MIEISFQQPHAGLCMRAQQHWHTHLHTLRDWRRGGGAQQGAWPRLRAAREGQG